MTESDAKTKWCPHVRYPNLMESELVAGNKYSAGCNTNAQGSRTPVAFTCIASDCMMWKWDEAFDVDKDDNPIGGTNYDTEGHCGLIKEG